MKKVTIETRTNYQAAVERLAEELKTPLKLARVVIQQAGNFYTVRDETGVRQATLKGSLRQALESEIVVGDWVAIRATAEDQALIVAVLPRFSTFRRKRPGPQEKEQIFAANLTRLLIVTAMNQEFNARRLERYVAQAQHYALPATIVLTKADLAEDPDFYVELATRSCPEAEIAVVEALAGPAGIATIQPFLQPEETLVLIGSSGVGKSTLLNAILAQEAMVVHQTSTATGKGMHTTTHRELHVLENGAAVIDTPGVRELGTTLETTDEVLASFPDIQKWAEYCFFADCQHQSEKGCQVEAAIERGLLAEERLISYRKLLRETHFTLHKDKLVQRSLRRKEKTKRNTYNRKQKHKQHQWDAEAFDNN